MCSKPCSSHTDQIAHACEKKRRIHIQIVAHISHIPTHNSHTRNQSAAIDFLFSILHRICTHIDGINYACRVNSIERYREKTHEINNGTAINHTRSRSVAAFNADCFNNSEFASEINNNTNKKMPWLCMIFLRRPECIAFIAKPHAHSYLRMKTQNVW